MSQEDLQEELAQLRAENQRLRELLIRHDPLMTIPGLEETKDSPESTDPFIRSLSTENHEAITKGGSLRYRPSEEIGRGAVGKVMLAYDPILLREVALKTLNAEFAAKPS